MPTDDEPTHRPHSTAGTTGAPSSSRYSHSSRHSQAGPGGTRTGSTSRRTGDASVQPPSQPPPTYRTNAPNASQGTLLQLGEVEEEPPEPTVVKASHSSSSRRTKEPTQIKQAPSMHQPSLLDSSRRTQQGLSRLDQINSKMQEPSHHPSRRTQQGLSRLDQIASKMQEQSNRPSSQRYQESSIVKQPISSKHQLSQHPSSKKYQEPTIVKRPLPSIREQPASIRKELIPSMQKDPLPSMRKDPSQFKSMAPPIARSILQTPEDVKMASRQTRIESLPPVGRKAQEEWAQSMIKRAGVCPENFAWKRQPGGYQCEGGGYGITDGLLAEGKGGIMAHRTRKWEVSEGPYYQDPNTPGRFLRHDGQGYFRGATPTAEPEPQGSSRY